MSQIGYHRSARPASIFFALPRCTTITSMSLRHNLPPPGTAHRQQAHTRLTGEHGVVQLDQPCLDRGRPRLAPGPTEQGLVGEQTFAFGKDH